MIGCFGFGSGCFVGFGVVIFCLSGCFDLMLIFGCFTFCGLCLRFDACGFVVFKLIDLFFGLFGVLVVVLLLVFWFG